MRARSLLPVLACALGARVSADVLVVGPARAHATIQLAINAAHDGDVILVEPGTYPSFAVSNRALTIVADSGGPVIVNGAIMVFDLAATRDVVVCGLTATGIYAVMPLTVYGLYAANCAGSLRVQDCDLRGWPNPAADPCTLRADGALLQNCQDVVFTRTRLEGADRNTLFVPPGTGSFPGAGHALFAYSSRVALYECSLSGGDAGLDVLLCSGGYGYLAEDGADAGHGIAAVSSFVFVAASDLLGGRGGDADPSGCGNGGNGGSGGFTSTPVGTFVLDNTTAGGPGGAGHFDPLDPFCMPHDGNPGTTWAGGSGPTTFAAPARSCAVPRILREGAQLTLTLSGRPGDVVELAMSGTTGFRFRQNARGVDTLHGTGQPAAVPVTTVGTLPAGGVLTLIWTVPELGPGIAAEVLHVQTAFTGVNGRVTLATPQAIVLLDSAW